jgi:hypothetical protein
MYTDTRLSPGRAEDQWTSRAPASGAREWSTGGGERRWCRSSCRWLRRGAAPRPGRSRSSQRRDPLLEVSEARNWTNRSGSFSSRQMPTDPIPTCSWPSMKCLRRPDERVPRPRVAACTAEARRPRQPENLRQSASILSAHHPRHIRNKSYISMGVRRRQPAGHAPGGRGRAVVSSNAQADDRVHALCWLELASRRGRAR